MRNIFLGVCLAPYRVDLYNYLYDNFSCDIYFQTDNPDNIAFDLKALEKDCHYPKRLLRTKRLGKRNVVCGLKKMLRDSNPDVVFVPEFSPITFQVVIYRKLLGMKFNIVSICDDSFDMISGNDSSRGHRLARRLALPLIDSLLVPDKRSVEWYQKRFKKGIWFPIIADDDIRRKEYDRVLPLSAKLNAEYGLKNKKVVMYVGRLVDIKNVSSLLEAFAPIKAEAKLVIVGNGNEREMLKEKNKRLDCNALFVGSKSGDELLAWYNIADVFVLPSIQEPFGAVTNEALLAGCRVVISERCGSASLVTEENGEIVSPVNVKEMTAAIKRQLDKISIDKDYSALRPNMMPVGFKESIDNVLKQITSMVKVFHIVTNFNLGGG